MIRKQLKFKNVGILSALIATITTANSTARADEVVDLKAQTAQLDEVRPDQQPNSAAATSGHTTLYGNARANAAVSDDTFNLALQKLKAGTKLSADEYRSLHVGCGGYEGYHVFFQKTTVITKVYKGSPADKAGICIGDRIIEEDQETAAAYAHPTVPLWQVKFGQEGSLVTVTILREAGPVRVTLARMNIEDIEEEHYRRQWERIISELGFPDEGTFVGTSLHNLEQVK
jgi:C-terminal processing protease CtpA/Prc